VNGTTVKGRPPPRSPWCSTATTNAPTPAYRRTWCERLPKSKLDIIDAGHFTWEDGADEYAALVTSWWDGGYATAGSAAAR